MYILMDSRVASSSSSKKHVIIYTDGACAGNPGPGGWGAVLFYGSKSKEIYGGALETTNNRMELMAAIESLHCLKEACVIDLYTDSQYVRNGITQWIGQWKLKNWRTAGNKPVKNADLWQALEQAAARHEIHWHWVEGHAGNAGNELADKLAVKGCKEIQASSLL